MAKTGKDKTRDKWLRKSFTPPDGQFLGETVEPTDPTGITETPLQCIKWFITQEILELIVEYTNMYSVEKQGKCVNTCLKEIKQVLGMLFKMGLAEMPSCRDILGEQDTQQLQM